LRNIYGDTLENALQTRIPMNEKFNWRRVLAFTPVTVALAFLTVYGPNVVPHYLVGLFVVFLFFAFFLIFYTSPRWKPTLPPINARVGLLLVIWLVVALIGVGWAQRRFPQALPWVTPLVIFASLAVVFVRARRAPK
jgi:hypothetical protein